MNDDQIRHDILKLLYIQSMRCASSVKIKFIIKNIDEISKDDLLIHIDYLKREGYVQISQIDDGFTITEECKITRAGIYLIKEKMPN